MKRFVAPILVLMLALSGVSALAAYSSTMIVVNCEEWVSLRSSPSTSASRIATVLLGETVEADGTVGSFTHCYYHGREGYILSQYLASYNPDGSYSGEYDGSGPMYVVGCDEWVSLRSSPSTSAPRITKVPLGAMVIVHGWEGDFMYCTYGNQQGYILSGYLSPYPR